MKVVVGGDFSKRTNELRERVFALEDVERGKAHTLAGLDELDAIVVNVVSNPRGRNYEAGGVQRLAQLALKFKKPLAVVYPAYAAETAAIHDALDWTSAARPTILPYEVNHFEEVVPRIAAWLVEMATEEA